MILHQCLYGKRTRSQIFLGNSDKLVKNSKVNLLDLVMPQQCLVLVIHGKKLLGLINKNK